MKKRTEKKVNYTKLVDLLNNWIELQKMRNRNISNIIKDLDEKIRTEVILKPEDYKKHINTHTAILLDALVPKKATPNEILMLIESFLDYQTGTSDFRRIQNVFTLMEYSKDPDKLNDLVTNWKDIMGKTK